MADKHIRVYEVHRKSDINWIADAKDACSKQSVQLRNYWGQPTLVWGTNNPDASLYIGNASDLHAMNQQTPEDLGGKDGYHTLNKQGNPLIVVELSGDDSHDQKVMSHEVCETLINPRLNRRILGHLCEVCDPVANPNWWYTADNGVMLADFVLPCYFEETIIGPWDFLGALHGAINTLTPQQQYRH